MNKNVGLKRMIQFSVCVCVCVLCARARVCVCVCVCVRVCVRHSPIANFTNRLRKAMLCSTDFEIYNYVIW